MEIVHAIVTFDRRDHGTHKTRCGKYLNQMDKYSMKLEEINCPQCRRGWINSTIGALDTEINNFTRLGMDDEFLNELREKRDHYISML